MGWRKLGKSTASSVISTPTNWQPRGSRRSSAVPNWYRGRWPEASDVSEAASESRTFRSTVKKKLASNAWAMRRRLPRFIAFETRSTPTAKYPLKTYPPRTCFLRRTLAHALRNRPGNSWGQSAHPLRGQDFERVPKKEVPRRGRCPAGERNAYFGRAARENRRFRTAPPRRCCR